MGKNLIETVMGGVVLLVAGMFLVFAYSHADLAEIKGYPLSAKFTRVGGLTTGSDVRINGIRVGTVTAQVLDTETYMADIHMNIEQNVRLPEDSQVSIVSDGLLGGNYLRIQPGRSKATIPAGGWIANTKDYRALEELVGDVIFSVTNQNNKGEGAEPASSAP